MLRAIRVYLCKRCHEGLPCRALWHDFRLRRRCGHCGTRSLCLSCGPSLPNGSKRPERPPAGQIFQYRHTASLSYPRRRR